MNTLIRFLYALLIAVSLVIFVGVGIYSLYQPPEYPSYESRSSTSLSNDDYKQTYDSYQDKEDTYYRNVSLIAIPLASLAAVGGLDLVRRRSDVVGEGLALGGVAIAIYGVITASMADSRPLLFGSVTILLSIVLGVAHFRFSPKFNKTLTTQI